MSTRLDEYLDKPSVITSQELIAWLEAEKGQPITHNGRVVGAVHHHSVMGKIYVTYRQKNEHLYRKWSSIGISRDVIIKLMNLGVQRILVVFKDTSEIYMTTPQKYLHEGRNLWFNYESDSQLHLPIDSMIRIP
uniref:Uncharacterized protein n=1 Tax=Ignisphaera aggregans TaxID=334771 RepID=A0A7J3JQH0_9CREN